MKCPHYQAENRGVATFCGECGHSLIEQVLKPAKPASTEPISFANDRYRVKRKL